MATTSLTDGGYVVTSEPSGTNDLHVQKYSSTGTPVGPEFVYHAQIGIGPIADVIALSNGGYAVAIDEFTGAHFGGPADDLFVFDVLGQEVNASRTTGMDSITLTASPRGGFIFTGGASGNFFPLNPGMYDGQLYLYDNSGDLLGGGMIASDPGPSVTLLSNGNFQLSWQDASESRATRTLIIDPNSASNLSAQAAPVVTAYDDVPPVIGVITGPTDDTTPTIRVPVSGVGSIEISELVAGTTWYQITPQDISQGYKDVTLSLDNGDHRLYVRIENANGVIGGSTSLSLAINTALTASATRTDFNGDLNADILWQNTSGQAKIWLMNGSARSGGSNVGSDPGSSWNVKAAGDFNADGKSDILWQNADGTVAIWYMNGTAVIGGGLAGSNTNPNWLVIGEGDFNADGHADVLWQNADGTPAIWLMNGTGIVSGAAFANPGTVWHVVGAGDFNGDGNSDILWQNDSGQAAIWLMNGTSILGGGLAGYNPGTSWHAKAAGDFNGDGRSDILWQNSDGTPAIWLMNGNNMIGGSTVGFNPGSSWQAVGAGDFNGDGKADILWEDSDGTPAVWLMNGLSLLSGGSPGFSPGSSWRVIAMSS